MEKISLSAISVSLMILTSGGCSTSSPSQADIDSTENSEDYWRASYERQCIASGIRPGTPMLVKCVDDLMDIRSEQPED